MPAVLASVARIVVGAALLVAGALKLTDPRWPAAAASLGVPPGMARLVAPTEIAVGALTAAGVAAPWPALATLGLLAAFTLVLGAALRAGRRPVCACYGRLSAAPVGVGSLLRNVALMLLAAVALRG